MPKESSSPSPNKEISDEEDESFNYSNTVPKKKGRSKYAGKAIEVEQGAFEEGSRQKTKTN